MVMAGLMGFVILISNVEPIIDKVAEYAGIEPPKVVYLTPEQCRDRDLDCPSFPTVDVNSEFFKDEKYSNQSIQELFHSYPLSVDRYAYLYILTNFTPAAAI